MEEITTEEFVEKLFLGIDLLRYGQEKDLCLMAYEKLLIENYDYLYRSAPIEKKAAARIGHQVLRRVLGEEDQKEIQGAEKLQDLYDCHTCVLHIAQMYVKGIMKESEEGIFGNQEKITRKEAEEIIDKMLHKEARRPIVL